jgi:hypothetical protein
MITHPPGKNAAVVIPFRNRGYLTQSEQISLRHLETYLSHYDRYFVVPEGLQFTREGYEIKHFPRQYFGSIKANEKLMLSRYLYESFREYRFILIYHLDSLVFSDQLSYWCDQDYDYIGAPWILCNDLPKRKIEGVGNGGFSLMKVESILRVLNSNEKWIQQADVVNYYYNKSSFKYRYKNIFRIFMLQLPAPNDINRHIKYNINLKMSGDAFWEKYGKHYYSEFKVAPVDVALKFAIECAPRTCFERNGRVLPFGCHAWERFDKEFWEPYVLNGK